MKKILIVTLGIFLCCEAAEAQFFLDKLGKTVQKKVTEKVTDAVRQELRKNVSGKETTSRSASRSASQPSSQPVSQPAASKVQNVKVKDEGQNILRQEGLDYIDEYGINHGGGILIGDVLWAPVNCGYHETDYPYGKLYQWGRKHGQGYGAPFTKLTKVTDNADKTTAEIVPAPVTPAEALKHPDRFYARSDMSSFNWTRNDMSLWCPLVEEGKATKHPKYDPCPEGWRVPELFDFKSLAEHYSDFVEYPEGGPKGRWFSGPVEYSTEAQRIFLPASGMRTRDGASHSRDEQAIYWSLRHGGGEGLVWHLYLNDYEAEVSPSAFPHEAYSVRCVKDIEGQRLK